MAEVPERRSHGGKRKCSGRKRKYEDDSTKKKIWNREHQRIYLTQKLHETWKESKYLAGYDSSSDSDFAAHLLSLEYRRRTEANKCFENINNWTKRTEPCVGDAFADLNISNMETLDTASEGPHTSTPLKVVPPKLPLIQNQSPITKDKGTDGVILEEEAASAGETSLDKLNVSLFTDDEGASLEEISSDESVSLHEISSSAVRFLNEEQGLVERDKSISEDLTSDGGENSEEESDMIMELNVDVDSKLHEHTNIEEDSSVQDDSISSSSLIYGPHKKLSRGEELNYHGQEIKLICSQKVICSLDLLLKVFQDRCQTPGCVNTTTVKHHIVGTTVIIHCSCLSGHDFKFYSSHEVNGTYVNNIQAAASILLSGNSYSKIERLAKFYGLKFVSSSTYYRMQRLYMIPSINEWWSWMREEIWQEFSDQKELVVGGDGQCDSPGFNAKNLCYFLVEAETNYIIDIEVLDKRHVGLSSTNMEKEAIRRGLNAITKSLNVVELVTDASTSIISLLEKEFADIIHSLDVWHKSKSIKKCLAKIGKPKAMRKIQDWSPHIVRHFWHCANVCKKDGLTSDKEALKVMKDKWIALLHHVCNEHDWLGGQCDHSSDVHDESLPWFDHRDRDFLELQKVILNPELLASFKYYTRFRHTGNIECANSLSLMYTPKRIPFSYKAYKARKQLAAIDWNFHVNLPQAIGSSGDKLMTRKYNPRTRQWDQKIVKINKGYEYIPLLMAKILQKRQQDVGGVTQNVSLNESDPGLIAPTIAHVPAPATKEICQRRSRFEQKN